MDELHAWEATEAMILERSMTDQFLSNTYLLREGDKAVLVDAGGPVAPLIDPLEHLDFILLTHHHHDHIAELDTVRERFPGAGVLAHPAEGIAVAEPWLPGETLTVGPLEIEPLHTPGHTEGMLSLHVAGEVFTGDTLFKNTVGGVRAPGSTSYADIKHSIMEVLLALPGETVVRPGHTDPTTVADEWEHNPFVRVWRGLDPEGDEPCVALGNEATLILRAPDYDGGTKCWVRWPDGADDIVPGSQVQGR
jgi:hydroxyacylglutathione hydrolase